MRNEDSYIYCNLFLSLSGNRKSDDKPYNKFMLMKVIDPLHWLKILLLGKNMKGKVSSNTHILLIKENKIR